ncbi:MAG: PH domain-containing protein [Lachnospiraceae bacterium]|jgi:hypothetical protein|nr:PH domain-containing protein [Lachnospiraceae bacterium]
MADKNTEVKSTDVLWKDRKHFMWFPFSFTKYEVRDERLFIEKGLLSTSFDETLLYRITDIRLIRSLGQKLCGTGTIELCTKVDHDKHISLVNIKKPMEVKTLLSDAVEEARMKKNVVGKEFYGGHGPRPGEGPDHEPDLDDDFL